MIPINQHTFSNGLTIVTHFIPGVKTVALHWGVRAGVAMNTHDGESTILAELIQRGVRGLNAKEHNDALDAIGVKKQVSCGIEYFRISSVMLGNRLFEAIPLLGAYITSPTLPEEHLNPCKSLCLQSIQSIQDNPSHLASIELNKHHLPSPYNRSSYGTVDAIEQASITQLQHTFKRLFVPKDSILVLAGDVNHEQVIQHVEEHTSEWARDVDGTIIKEVPSQRGVHWIQQDTSQVHLAFAFDGPVASSQNSILESVAISIFGGATSGRLFTQVRQRRSLCYSVSAQYAPAKERSVVRMHAGTTPERAEETAQVCLEQLAELKNGITEEEFLRTIQRMKSRIVMHSESTSARATSIWGDQYALGKARTLEERLKEIEAVKHSDVNSWLEEREFGALTCVAVGPERLCIEHPLV